MWEGKRLPPWCQGSGPNIGASTDTFVIVRVPLYKYGIVYPRTLF